MGTVVDGGDWLGIGRDPGVVPRTEDKKSKVSMSGSKVIFLPSRCQRVHMH